MGNPNIVLGTINSIPAGLPEQEIEVLYQSAYKPFLGVLYNFPDINMTMYLSGALLIWLDRHHPEYGDVLGELVARKQVELLGGAFYDPILSITPRSDRVGQIESLTTYLRKRFGKKPRGFWIPEGEWLSSLPLTLKTCLFDYTFLDEAHFFAAGMGPDNLAEPVITEDQGKSIIVFPIARRLASLASTTAAEVLVPLLIDDTEKGRGPVVFLDGKVFGGFPGTFDRCYRERWLEQLFAALVTKGVETQHPGRQLRAFPADRRAFFPAGCRDVDLSHGLGYDQQGRYAEFEEELRGKANWRGFCAPGLFKNFLVRYEEAHLLYCKMQHSHILVNQVRRDKYRKQAAREELWRGQNGAPFRHGWEGGVYNNHLRKRAYCSLISAEKVTREKGVFIPSVVAYDFDFDGSDEYLYQGNEINAYVHTRGGAVFELDHLPTCWNYLDTCRRHREHYHTREHASGGFDAQPRRGFQDRFLAEDADLARFARGALPELGSFVDGQYEVIKLDREHGELVLERAGVAKAGRRDVRLQITKKFIFKRASINLYYTVKNLDDRPFAAIFGSELNLSFASPTVDSLQLSMNDGNQKLEIPSDPTTMERMTELVFEDVLNDTTLTLSTLEPASAFCVPVETMTKSAGVVKSIYQGSSALPMWHLSLDPQASWENRLSLRFD